MKTIRFIMVLALVAGIFPVKIYADAPTADAKSSAQALESCKEQGLVGKKLEECIQQKKTGAEGEAVNKDEESQKQGDQDFDTSDEETDEEEGSDEAEGQ